MQVKLEMVEKEPKMKNVDSHDNRVTPSLSV